MLDILGIYVIFVATLVSLQKCSKSIVELANDANKEPSIFLLPLLSKYPTNYLEARRVYTNYQLLLKNFGLNMALMAEIEITMETGGFPFKTSRIFSLSSLIVST